MSNKDVVSLIRFVVIAVVLYAIGRFFVVQMGNNGSWLIIVGVIVFYAVWWNNYQRNKKK